MFRLIASTAVSLATLSPTYADTTAPDLTLVKAPAPTLVPEETSDCTPDNPHPNRTQGATITGATDTEVARPPFGTSDRTPSNHSSHPTN